MKLVSSLLKRKLKSTFEVIVQLHDIKGLDKSLHGCYVYCAWKRGDHSGSTLKTLVQNGVAIWDDSSINLSW
jgi:hypothetical protein